VSIQETERAEERAKPIGAGHASFWLRLIGAGKLLKAAFLITLGFGVLRLVHTGFGDEMATIASYLRYNPESHVLIWMLDKASLLSDRRLEQVGAGLLFYAATELVESYGLLRQRLWGEYLTCGYTIAFLPFDIYELLVHFTWIKLAFTILNAIIAWYLAWHILRKRRMKEQAEMTAADQNPVAN
jgi:uncharacterized membrane protein (DUF2068 family)